MAENPGNADVSTRVKHVRAELSEWEGRLPIDHTIRGKQPEEIMRLVMEEKERIEERLKIIGRNFPMVHEDARQIVNLVRSCVTEPSLELKLKNSEEINKLFLAYENKDDGRIVLKPIFMIALQDFSDYEAISWKPR